VSGIQFLALPAEGTVIAELEATAPANPFATAAYIDARRRLGHTVRVVGLRNESGRLEQACAAFMRRGRLSYKLEITSLPSADAASPFWAGLQHFCRREGVTALELNTFATPAVVGIPRLSAHGSERKRCEFVLDLAQDLPASLDSNHKRNVKKAQKAGLTLQRTRAAGAAATHRVLMGQSMDRRRARGENVAHIGPSPEDMALLESHAGELFQAVQGSAVMSSVLVLHAPRGGYYQSAGSTPDGMAMGASHFLMHSIATELKAGGAHLFNLGGAEEESSLARFKEGFGTTKVHLTAASFDVGPAWRRLITQGIARLRR
jgi:hypothetical protein